MKRLALWFVVCLALLVNAGCEDGLTTGILIGTGSSAALTEGQRLAQQSKAALIAEIAATREKLKQAADPNEIEAIKGQLQKLEFKESIAAAAEASANKVMEGAQRDWSTNEPQKQRENVEWIIGTAIAAFFGLKELRQRRAIEKGVAKYSAENQPDTAKQLYDDISHYSKKAIP